jgi:hypothetical protein
LGAVSLTLTVRFFFAFVSVIEAGAEMLRILEKKFRCTAKGA